MSFFFLKNHIISVAWEGVGAGAPLTTPPVQSLHTHGPIYNPKAHNNCFSSKSSVIAWFSKVVVVVADVVVVVRMVLV